MNRSAVGGTLALALLAGCGQADAGLPRGDDPATPDPAELSVDVTNPWFPLKPSTRWVYAETTEDGEKVEVIVTVTSATKAIKSGGSARVVRDTVRQDDKIIEDTKDWYAQDAAGNVWYLGEDTAEFENGRLTTREGSFESGVDGALPGVIMPAEPKIGMAYRQEYYRGTAEDNGEVLALGKTARVPAGAYKDLLQTADTTPLEQDVLEHKYYARDVGLVLTVDVGEGGGREELLSTSKVSAAEAERAGNAPLGKPY